MIQLLNLNKILILVSILIFSCNDDNVNYLACSPNQILDSCGQCYYSEEDDDFDSCLDECEIQYGGNICDLEGVLGGDCDCSGCTEFGNPAYCDDCLVSDACACNHDQMLSMIPININPDCSDLNNCDSYSFDDNNLTLDIRQRCGTLLNINANYTLQSLMDIQFNDPCGEPINIDYFDDEGINYDITSGCDLPINTVYIDNTNTCNQHTTITQCNQNEEEECEWITSIGCVDNTYNVLYNSSDDISDFEFNIYNHCENISSGLCEATDGCSYTGNECVLDNYNYISGGDAQNSNFDITSEFVGSNYFIFGEMCDELEDCEVIPDDSDHINEILFYNNDTVNSIYLKWPDVIPNTDYIEIEPENFLY